MHYMSGHFSGTLPRCEILRLYGRANVEDILAAWWLQRIQRAGALGVFVLPLLSFAIQRLLAYLGGYTARAAWTLGLGLSSAFLGFLLVVCTWRWRYHYKQARAHEARAIKAESDYTANAVDALVRLDPRLTTRRANTQQGDEPSR